MTEIEKLYSLAGVDFGYNNFGVPNIQPPFTAEKQIAILDFLLQEVDYITMWLFGKDDYDFTLGKHTSKAKSFDECVAGLVIDLWQDLTADEQNEIRGILK